MKKILYTISTLAVVSSATSFLTDTPTVSVTNNNNKKNIKNIGSYKEYLLQYLISDDSCGMSCVFDNILKTPSNKGFYTADKVQSITLTKQDAIYLYFQVKSNLINAAIYGKLTPVTFNVKMRKDNYLISYFNFQSRTLSNISDPRTSSADIQLINLLEKNNYALLKSYISDRTYTKPISADLAPKSISHSDTGFNYMYDIHGLSRVKMNINYIPVQNPKAEYEITFNAFYNTSTQTYIIPDLITLK